MEQLHADYKTVLSALQEGGDGNLFKELAQKMPRFTPARLKIEVRSFASAEEAEREIGAVVATCAGWLRRQSGVVICPLEETCNDPQAGWPLAGEWVISDDGKQSQRLVHDGRQWWLWTYEELEGEQAEGTPCLRQELSHLFAREFAASFCGASENIDQLRYAVYWTASPQDPAQITRHLARFIGFKPSDQQEKERK